MRRSLFATEIGARTWRGWGVLAHNTTKLRRLEADRNGSRHHHTHRPANNPKGEPREVERGQIE